MAADYTNSQTQPLDRCSQMPWANRDAIVQRNMQAEAAYRQQFGPRPVTIHILVRFAERQTPGFALTPARWPYIQRWPDNVTLFCTVDITGLVIWEGWLSHAEIALRAVPGKDADTHIIEPPYHSMENFHGQI